MTTSVRTSSRLFAASFLLPFFLLGYSADAAVSYWDKAGNLGAYTTYTAGSLAGTWETANWSRNTAGASGAPADKGQATPVAWTEGDAAVFAVGAGATNAGVAASTTAFTVTMNANHTVAGFFSGPLNPNSCIVTINGSGIVTLPTGQDAFNVANSGDSSLGQVIMNNVLTGPGQITAEGNGQIFLNGTNTFTGGITLGYSLTTFSGIINFNNSASFGTGSIIVSNTAALISALVVEGSSAVTITNPVTLVTSNNPSLNIVGNPAGLTFAGPWNLNTRTLTLGSGVAGNLVNISGVISGSGGLTKFNPGILELTAANTYSGVTTVNNGILQLGDGVTKNGSVAGTTTITSPGILVYANPNAQTYAQVISGTGSLVKQAPGVLTLTKANTYSGNTTNLAGTIKLGIANALPNGAGKGDLYLSGTLDMGAFSGAINGLNGGGTVDNTTGAATYTLTAGNNAANGNFSGVIKNTSGTVALTKAGAGSLTLSGANTYAGATTIGGGTLQLGADNSLPAASSVIVTNGATLDMASYNDIIAALSGAGAVINNNAVLTVNGNANAPAGQNFNGYSCIAGVLSGAGGLVKGGTHAMALRGDNSTYAGPITLSAGILSVGAAPNRLPISIPLSVPAGALFQLDAGSQTVGSLTGSGKVNLGGGTLTVNQSGSPDIFSGVIQDSELAGSSTASGHGLRGYYYTNIDFTGLGTVRDDATVNLADMSALPGYSPTAKTNQISVRWLGQVLTTVGGSYSFATRCDDGSRLWINGILVVDNWVLQGATTKSGSLSLSANTRYDVVMEYFNNGSAGASQLFWTPPGDSSVIIPAANLFLPGPGTLVLTGSGTQQLTALNSYSGGTTVNGGTLEATIGGALGTGNVTVGNGATLILDSNTGISPTADLTAGTSLVNLNYIGANNIHGLSMDGGATYQPAGTYGSAASGAANQSSLFAGLGILNVAAAPSANVLSASAATLVYGSALTLTSTITGSGATPTGTVTFYDNGNILGTAALNLSGVAIFSVSNLLVTASPHSVTAMFGGDIHYAQSASSPVSVTTTAVTIIPIPVVANKIYDGTNTATIASITFGGILDSDTNYVHISGAYTATFADKNVGVNKNVSITGLALTGSLSANYTLSTSSVSTTANITNKVLNISGITATNRLYDSTTNAGFTGTAALVSAMIVSPDVVTLGGTPALYFTTKAVGTNKPVIVSGYSIGTTGDATNYVLVLTNLSANITNLGVSINGITVNSKVYDGSTAASLSGTPALSPASFAGDVVNIGGTITANFSNAGVGNAKAVTVTGYLLSGADAPNYLLSQPSGLTANISKAATTSLLTSSANPSTLTSNVTFTFTATSTTPTTNPPTGTVTFFTNSTAVSPVVTLVSNSPTTATASFTTALLPLGTNTVQAVYGGDTNFLAPLSPSLQQVVQSTVCSQTNTLLGISHGVGNSFTLIFKGTYQAQYYVISQTNLAQPFANWQPVPGSTNTVSDAGGLWTLTVTNPASASFYRSAATTVCP
jgi:autotransporter-associated beta strand protein